MVRLVTAWLFWALASTAAPAADGLAGVWLAEPDYADALFTEGLTTLSIPVLVLRPEGSFAYLHLVSTCDPLDADGRPLLLSGGPADAAGVQRCQEVAATYERDVGRAFVRPVMLGRWSATESGPGSFQLRFDVAARQRTDRRDEENLAYQLQQGLPAARRRLNTLFADLWSPAMFGDGASPRVRREGDVLTVTTAGPDRPARFRLASREAVTSTVQILTGLDASYVDYFRCALGRVESVLDRPPEARSEDDRNLLAFAALGGESMDLERRRSALEALDPGDPRTPALEAELTAAFQDYVPRLQASPVVRAWQATGVQGVLGCRPARTDPLPAPAAPR